MTSFKQFLAEAAGDWLYVDMDGVLCDWNEAAFNITHHKYSGTIPLEQRIRIFSESFDFWANMNWTEGGERLWKNIRRYEPCVLSSYDAADVNSKPGKMAWCQNKLHIAPERVKLVPTSASKTQYAGPGKVLIDDFPDNIQRWKDAGGIGIVYLNPDQAFRELQAAIKQVSQ
jgi:hypothetical protein